ncbi:Protein of unknown function [Bacillus cereus]|nr:Protein of unknown function [Bacillus cereus]
MRRTQGIIEVQARKPR